MTVSARHERRAGLLAAMAALAGCRTTACLAPGLAPDVVTADPRLRRLFVADAKDTETAGCAATARRLRRYLRAAQGWRDVGYSVRVTLCASSDARGWEATLLRAALEVGAPVAAHGQVVVGDDALAWVDLATRP